MRELVEYIARSLVEDPERVSVEEHESEKGTVVHLRVAPEDRGRVIGRQGRTARSIRTLLAAAASRSGTRVMLEILD